MIPRSQHLEGGDAEKEVSQQWKAAGSAAPICALESSPWREGEATGRDEVTPVISGATDSSLESFLPAFPSRLFYRYLVSSTPGDGLPPRGPSDLFLFKRWLFSEVFHFFLWTNFIAHSLLFGCLGREMLYIKISYFIL